MHFITVQKMKELEVRNNAAGLGWYAMMDNAGKAAARLISEEWDLRGRRVTAVCGRGNNGGDGMVSAAALAKTGARVTVALPFGEPRTDEAKTARAHLRESPEVEVALGMDAAKEAIAGAELLLDCIFGTGFKGEPDADARTLIEAVNAADAQVIAYDIPSGVEADTGKYLCCVKSVLTIAFDAYKAAHLVNWSAEYTQRSAVVSIGTAPETIQTFDGYIPVIDRAYFREHRPVRSNTGNKGTNGRAVMLVGSETYRGAATLSTRGALRAGAGYVELVSTGEVCRQALAASPELICTVCRTAPDGGIARESDDAVLRALEKADAVVMGCGLGNSESTARLVHLVLENSAVPIVLDADALNVLAKTPEALRTAKAPLILTPHAGEFCRLFGGEAADAANNPAPHAQNIAKEYGLTILLKGPITVIAGPEGTLASFLGNSGLARGGSGDVLAGFIGAMAARGLSPLEAAACGAYLHGRSADIAAQRRSREAMLPGDLPELVGEVFLEL